LPDYDYVVRGWAGIQGSAWHAVLFLSCGTQCRGRHATDRQSAYSRRQELWRQYPANDSEDLSACDAAPNDQRHTPRFRLRVDRYFARGNQALEQRHRFPDHPDLQYFRHAGDVCDVDRSVRPGDRRQCADWQARRAGQHKTKLNDSQEDGMTRMRYLKAAVTALAWLSATSAFADDLVKMTIGQRGNWDTSITHLGDKDGIFKKHGLQLEMIYTSGSGETLQPVSPGSVDLGLAVGTLGAMAAYAKGAPVRIIGAQATGAADYWYAKNPAIKTLKDANGHTIAFSTNGSSTNSVVRAFIDEFKLTAKPQATGNPSATLTAVMTDQVDVGWAAPPFGLKEMDEGKIHLVARATDAALVRGQTIRVLVANADALEKRK